MSNRIEVEVLPAGDGKVYMASNLKALPQAKAGDVIGVKAGPYADGLVEAGLVAYLTADEPAGTDAPQVDDLTAISGLGKASADKLTSAGVTTFAELAGADTAVLAEATGIAANKLEEWHAAALTLTKDGE